MPHAAKAAGNSSAPNPKYCHSVSDKYDPKYPKALTGASPVAVLKDGSAIRYVAKATATAMPAAMTASPAKRIAAL